MRRLLPPLSTPGRAWLRVGAGITLVLLAGALTEWQRFGRTNAEARVRIRHEVADEVERAAAALRRTADALGPLDRQRLSEVLAGDDEAARELFDRVRRAREMVGPRVRAVTLFSVGGRPVAWDGQPLPAGAGTAADVAGAHVVVAPVGARLVQTIPVTSRTAGAPVTVGQLVVEAVLTDEVSGDGAFGVLPTAVIPVRLRSPGGPAAPDAGLIDLRVEPDGPVLGRLDVPERLLAEARRTWRRRTQALAGAVAVAGLLVTAAHLSGWWGVILVVMSRAVASPLMTLWGVTRTDTRGGVALLVASPVDLLLTGLLAIWLTWQAMTRLALVRRRVGAPGLLASLGRALRAGAAGAAVTVALSVALGTLTSGVTRLPLDVGRDLLHPLEPLRVTAVAGLMLLAAAALSAASLGLRLLSGLHRVARREATWWLPASAAIGMSIAALWQNAPDVLAPSLAALVTAVVGPSLLRRSRRRSQTTQLAAACLLLIVPAFAGYPALTRSSSDARRAEIAGHVSTEVMGLRAQARDHLQATQQALDAATTLPATLQALVDTSSAGTDGSGGNDAAFALWSSTPIGRARLTSAVELSAADGRRLGRFALKLPEADNGPPVRPTAGCGWETFEEVSRFYAEERRVLHTSRGVCVSAPDGRVRIVGAISLSLALEFANLPFITARTPYAALLQTGDVDVEALAHEDVELAVYGWSRRPVFTSAGQPWVLPDALMARVMASRTPFWTTLPRQDSLWEVYVMNDRAGVYALGIPQPSLLTHAVRLAEILLLAVLVVMALAAALTLGRIASGVVTDSPFRLLAEIRASFYRKLFLGFVAAVAVPVVALAIVTRTYAAGLLRADIEREAARVAATAGRMAADLATPPASLPIDDTRLVWLARAVDQDVNVFDGPTLLASSERALYASGLLPERTPADAYRAVALDGQSSHVSRERLGRYEYLVVSAPVRRGARDVVLTVPLSLQQQQTERQIDELDRRIVLAVVAFVLLGSALGYWMAERIADPMRRLTRATRRLAAGELDARVLVTSRDEFRRLVEDFNRMARELGRQRTALERTNRLQAWADAARQVAHDIKNPLTPIQLHAEHLRRVHEDQGRPLGALVDESVTTILAQVRTLRQIASEFSSFAATPRAVPDRVPVAPLLSELVTPYRSALEGRIAVLLDLPADLPDLWADRGLLARALVNVIENAVHAMPGQGTLRVRASVESGVMVLAVQDTGIGMDAAALARIFEPYFSTRATGTGLGLSIARRNLELQAGRIDVDSAPGVGTTVTVRVPLASAPAAAGGAQAL